MYALRALARRAPVRASQLSHYSTKSSFSALRPIISKPSTSLTLISRYPSLTSHFSTSAARCDSTGQELAAKLESEISIESENNEQDTDSNSNVKEFLGQTDWTLIDKEGEQDVLLERTFDDEKITVSFSIADFNSSMLPEEEMDEAYPDEDDDIESAQSGGGNTKGAINQGRTSAGNIKVAPEDSIAPADREEIRDEEDEDYASSQTAFPANVNVLITRTGKPGALRFHLVTDGSNITIQDVTHLPEASGDIAKLLRDHPETAYTGPPFAQLDEEVQTMMENYLDERGINTALAQFVPDYIDVKEQKEYLGWLGRVKGFVE